MRFASSPPLLSLGVVYLLAVLFVSTYWGLGLGLFTALLSALAFNFFHVLPTGRLTVAMARTGSPSVSSWLSP